MHGSNKELEFVHMIFISSQCWAVYLQITFMALIGSWVPAKSSQIGVVDRIFSRVQSRETCSTNNSSFAIDLNQVAVMLRSSTRRSLLLIDEFGKGTNPSDGISLLAATIRSLSNRYHREKQFFSFVKLKANDLRFALAEKMIAPEQ